MINTRWHEANPIPIYPRSVFLGWHLRHEAVCSCRPTPEAVLRELDALRIITPGRVDRIGVPGRADHGHGIDRRLPPVLIADG